MVTDEHQTEAEHWEDFIAGSISVYRTSRCFQRLYGCFLKKEGLTQLKVVPWGEKKRMR